MNLNALIEQILLCEQHITEQTQKIQEVKVAVIRCKNSIKRAAEIYEKTTEELDKKVQQLSAMRLQHDVMKKSHDQLLKQIEQVLIQKSHLSERLAKIKSQSKEEETNFLQEISRFNSDFSLPGNKETEFQSQTHTDFLQLEREVESLYKEMDLMICQNSCMSSMQEEKRALQLEQQSLDSIRKDLDQQLDDAKAMTESLRAERLFVKQKPLTDSTCLRQRKELEIYKEGEFKLLREALSSEIQFLKLKLNSSQGSEQH